MGTAGYEALVDGLNAVCGGRSKGGKPSTQPSIGRGNASLAAFGERSTTWRDRRDATHPRFGRLASVSRSSSALSCAQRSQGGRLPAPARQSLGLMRRASSHSSFVWKTAGAPASAEWNGSVRGIARVFVEISSPTCDQTP